MKDSIEIANNVLRRRDAYQANKQKKESTFRRITTSMTAAFFIISLLLCLSVGYAFAATLGVIDDFLGFFEERHGSMLSESQQQYIEQVYAEIGESITCNGVTVTLQGAITDGKTYYIFLDIVAPADISLESLSKHGLGFNRTLKSENPYRHDISSSSGGCIPVEDHDGKSNTISMILQTTVATPYYSKFSFADGCERTLCLENLCAYSDEYPYERYIIAEGLWNFKFSFAQAEKNDQPFMEVLSAPVICQFSQPSGGPISVSVNSINLNALGATLRYSYIGTQVDGGVDFGKIQIVMKDGSVVNAHPRSAISGPKSGHVSYVYDAPVLFSEVIYLIVNGQIVPVAQKP